LRAKSNASYAARVFYGHSCHFINLKSDRLLAAGNRYLPKVTMSQVRNLVALLLFLVALGLIAGLL